MAQVRQLLNNQALINRPKFAGRRLPTQKPSKELPANMRASAVPQPSVPMQQPASPVFALGTSRKQRFVSPLRALMRRVKALRDEFAWIHPKTYRAIKYTLVMAAIMVGAGLFSAATVFSGGFAALGGVPIIAALGGGLGGKLAVTAILTAGFSLLSGLFGALYHWVAGKAMQSLQKTAPNNQAVSISHTTSKLKHTLQHAPAPTSSPAVVNPGIAQVKPARPTTKLKVTMRRLNQQKTVDLPDWDEPVATKRI